MQERKEPKIQSGKLTGQSSSLPAGEQITDKAAIERKSLEAIELLLFYRTNHEWIDAIDILFFDWVTYYEPIDNDCASNVAGHISVLKDFFRALNGLKWTEIHTILKSDHKL